MFSSSSEDNGELRNSDTESDSDSSGRHSKGTARSNENEVPEIALWNLPPFIRDSMRTAHIELDDDQLREMIRPTLRSSMRPAPVIQTNVTRQLTPLPTPPPSDRYAYRRNRRMIQRLPDVSPRRRAFYCLGHILNDLCAAIWFSYTLLYLQAVTKIGAQTAGILVMVGQIVDAVFTPIAGYLIDKYDKKKMWHFFGTLLILISFPAIFSFCPFCDSEYHYPMYVYFALMISLFQIGWATVQISHLSMIPLIAPTRVDRSNLTITRYMSTVVASISVYLIAALYFGFDLTGAKEIGPADFFKFRDIVLIVVTIGFGFSMVFYMAINNTAYEEIPEPDSDFEDDLFNEPDPMSIPLPPPFGPGDYGSTEREEPTEPPEIRLNGNLLLQVSLLYMASRLYLTVNMIYIPLYLDERQRAGDIENQTKIAVASVPLFCFFVSLMTSLCLKFGAERLNDKVAYFIGCLCALLGCYWILHMVPKNSSILNIYLIGMLNGVANAATVISSLCITAELISEKVQNSAKIYATVAFLDKLICGIGVMLIEQNKCSDIENCPDYYRNVLGYVSFATILCGILVLINSFKTAEPRAYQAIR